MFIRLLLAFLLLLPAGYAFAACSDLLIGAKSRDGKYQWRGRCFKLTKGCRPCGKIHTRKIKYMTKGGGRCSRNTIASDRADGCSAPAKKLFELTLPAPSPKPRDMKLIFRLSTPYKYKFKAACQEHDICYATLGKTKIYCDRMFYRNMIDMCKRSGKWCKTMAQIYRKSVRGKRGNNSYSEGQNYANDNCR